MLFYLPLRTLSVYPARKHYSASSIFHVFKLPLVFSSAFQQAPKYFTVRWYSFSLLKDILLTWHFYFILGLLFTMMKIGGVNKTSCRIIISINIQMFIKGVVKHVVFLIKVKLQNFIQNTYGKNVWWRDTRTQKVSNGK